MNSTRQPKLSVSGGFSLIELMVAVSVLVLLTLMMASITNMVYRVTDSSAKKIEGNEQARLVLERIVLDMKSALVRADLDYQFTKRAGNDQLAFYAMLPGYAGDRGVSVVSYRVNNGRLERGTTGLSWRDGGGAKLLQFSGTAPTLVAPNSLDALLPAADSDDWQVLSDSVFRFEISFLLKNPLPSTGLEPAQNPAPDPPLKISDLAAIIFTAAQIDSKTRLTVSDLAPLIASLDDAAADQNTAAVWTGLIARPDYAATVSIPRPAANYIRVFQRYYYLP